MRGRAHAILAPSSLERALKCAGSVAIVEAIADKLHDEDDSGYKEEGTLAHSTAESYLRYLMEGANFVPPKEADSDMLFHAKDYGEFVQKTFLKFQKASEKGSCKFSIEKRAHYSDLTWGTTDFCAWGTSKKLKAPHSLIIDFKYGRGVERFAENDEQLMAYALCCEQDLLGQGEMFEKSYLYIFQPRVKESPDRWVCDKKTLQKFRAKIYTLEALVEGLLAADDVVEASMDHLNAEGLDHCRFCPLKTGCPEFRKESNKGSLAVLKAATPTTAEFSLMPIESLVEVYEKKSAIETFLKDVERTLLRRMLKGEDVPGLKLVESRSQRSWIDDEKKVAAKLKKLGCRRTHKKSLVTLGEVEQQIGKDKSLLKSITKMSNPKPQIAPIDDKRQAMALVASSDLLTVIKD